MSDSTHQPGYGWSTDTEYAIHQNTHPRHTFFSNYCHLGGY